MANSRWQMNRIGLVDFWYYDEEEFYFQDGRMLLRGSNGSGKSVTMQSFIPLILDGNMRPERLDPFGSRARKMENYLLEEGDGREERTSYLYLELKRQVGQNYLTIGIGMRARKNKKLETWYFYIGDGRRIGRDFSLYKDVDAKIAYSRLELKNRIGDGGQVLESQTEYMNLVNRLVFGFDSIEKYKEMLDLLIQLRSPKLSKDFKPTVLNEILSNSLLMLSEDDLRPMSEAIENMDALKTSLDTLKDSVQAAEQIEKVYDRYNRALLYEKAKQFSTGLSQLKKYEQAVHDNDRKILELQEKYRDCEMNYQALEQEEYVLKEKRNAMSDSDAVRLKEQEQNLLKSKEENEKTCARKEKQEQEKKDSLLDVSEAIRKQGEENEGRLDEMTELLEEMQETVEEIPFDEAVFMVQELQKEPGTAYDFVGHEKLLEDYREKVQNGIRILKEEQEIQGRYDTELKNLDERKKERDQAERERIQAEHQLQDIQEELIEQCFRWERSNRELKVEPEIMQELSRKIHGFDERSDYWEVKMPVQNLYQNYEGQLRQELFKRKNLQTSVAESLEQKREELSEVEAQQELCPERTAAVQNNRRRLSDLKIPHYSFYQVVDFDAKLTREQANRLEDALMQMGILDALIVPEEYRSQVLAMDPGCSDRYLFSDIKAVRENILDVLDIDNPEQDILLHQLISGILCGIGYDGDQVAGTTRICSDGSYRLGVLEGTIADEYEAQFIGASTRAHARQKRLEQLQLECQALEERKVQADQAVEEVRQRLNTLTQEWESFPTDVDIRVAVKEVGDAVLKAERMESAVLDAQKRTESAALRLKDVRKDVQGICGKAYLTPRLDLYTDADIALGLYQKKLNRLQVCQNLYCNGCASLVSQQERLDQIEADLDDIRYDLSSVNREIRGIEARLCDVQKQLQMTNYAELQAELEQCLARLDMIPKEKEAAAGRKSSLAEQCRQEENNRFENEKKRVQADSVVKILKRRFGEEYALNYVERPFVITEDLEDQAQKVIKMLNGVLDKKNSSDYSGELQGVYHKNRGYLLDYYLTMDSIFTEESGVQTEDEQTDGTDVSELGHLVQELGKRIDLMAKYHGVSVSFKSLIGKLKADVEEQERLLSDKDRELFEDILANTISKKIRARIHESNAWVEKMNQLMGQMHTSSGLKLNLRWKSKRAESEEQLDTKALVTLLQKDVEIMREEEVEQLSRHFRSKIVEARKLLEHSDSTQTFHAIMREVLDYRKWFEFQLEYQKAGEVKRELTDRAFFTFSGGEKAMSMYVPLFSAAVAKYKGAASDAPKIICLDEAFAGVDEMNIKDMFRLMVDFDFDFIINSQILWGDYETVPALAIYQLLRPENAKFVTVIPYMWNGKVMTLADREMNHG